MKGFIRKFTCRVALCVSACLVVLLSSGCETSVGTSGPVGAGAAVGGVKPASTPAPGVSPDVLRPHDFVAIVFSGVSAAPPRHEERIKDDGSLTLPLNLRIQAAGKNVGQLQRDIYDLYVPK